MAFFKNAYYSFLQLIAIHRGGTNGNQRPMGHITHLRKLEEEMKMLKTL